MRVPHYLTRTPAGFSFRMRVPADISRALGRRIIKCALRTRDLRQAQAFSLVLAARYAAAFKRLRERGMSGKSIDDWIRELQGKSLHDFTIERDANGALRIQAEPGDDAAALNEAIAQIGRINREFFGPATPSSPVPSPQPPAAVLSMRDAMQKWLTAIAADTLPKTFTIKKAAVAGLLQSVGPGYPLPNITRIDLSNHYQRLADEGISTPTRVNKQSYLGGFFDWVIAAGYYTQPNPARNHVAYGNSAKRKRKKLGFRAFDLDQVAALFAPCALADLPSSARWAALLGLYTGARASEIGQLLVADINSGTNGGVPTIRISDEGEFQRLKSEVSQRVVPIHLDLVALGFLDYVAQLPAEGRLFPRAKADAVNGAGNWISKSFSRHLAKHGKSWPQAKRGFHSLRKTVIQQMQGAGVASEMRAQIVGHELEDEHHASYSREFTPSEKLNGVISSGFKTTGLGALTYALNLVALRTALRA